MLLSIDRDNPLPLHAQIGQQIHLAIAKGDLRPGERLPTVRQLAVDLRVNSNTIARVYLELEREGTLETRRGLGTFVAAAATSVSASSAEKRQRQLDALCRAFVQSCSKEGFTLKEIRRALRDLAVNERKV